MYTVNWKQCLRFCTAVNDLTVYLNCVQVGESCESSQVTRFHITTPGTTVIEKKNDPCLVGMGKSIPMIHKNQAN